MEFWQEVTEQIECYVKEQKAEQMDALLKRFFPYLQTCARNAHFSAKNVGAYIPIEDFYSAYSFAVWKAVEDYSQRQDQTELKIKNVILYRLSIAEKNVWRTYKKRSGKQEDKGGVTYASARWQSLESVDYQIKESSEFTEQILVNTLLEKYQLIAPLDARFFTLLIEGYSCAEAAKIVLREMDYNARVRKKVERMKQRLKLFLIQENYFQSVCHK